MKKILIACLALVLAAATFAACVAETAEEPVNYIDLEGYYIVYDPEDVDFDTRIVIYMDEEIGNEVMERFHIIANYMIFYGKGEAGKYLKSIYVCKSEEDAVTFVNSVLGQGTIEGNIIITESGEEAFLVMADIFPKMSGYIDAMMEAGYMPLE